MPEDDDLNYPILALALLEKHGTGFTTDDVAQLWLDNLPAGRVFTAERAAYRNILDARPVARDRDPPATRSASGSARSSAPTCSAGSHRRRPVRRVPRVGRRRA